MLKNLNTFTNKAPLYSSLCLDALRIAVYAVMRLRNVSPNKVLANLASDLSIQACKLNVYTDSHLLEPNGQIMCILCALGWTVERFASTLIRNDSQHHSIDDLRADW